MAPEMAQRHLLGKDVRERGVELENGIDPDDRLRRCPNFAAAVGIGRHVRASDDMTECAGTV